MKRIVYLLVILFLPLKVFGIEVVGPLTEIPSRVDPGVTSKRLSPSLDPFFKPGVPIEEPTEKTAEDLAAEKIKFKLTKIKFAGNTAISTQELEAIFQPSYNKTISLAQLQRMVKDVTIKYRSEGYVLSRAILEPQVIENGVVKVTVIEGYISQVNITGNPGISRSLLERYGERIKQMRPLQYKLLERDMLMMDDLPGMTVKAVITPSKTTPASSDLTLVVDQDRFNAFASYDNYGTRFLGPQQTTVGATLNAVYAPGDSNIIRAETTAQTSQLQYYEVVHIQPIGINGWRILGGANYSNTQPGFTLKDFDVVGRSVSGFADLSYTAIRSRTKNLLFHAAINYQNVTSKILGTELYADRFRSLALGGRIDGTDSWRGVNVLGGDIEHGFKILGAHFNPLNQSRPKGVPDYTKINLNASRLQGISQRFSAWLAMEGQYAFNPLLATEQFAYGGSVWGRGYDPSEIIGDDGLGATAELRMDTAPELKFLRTIQYYGFYDGGIIWNRDKENLPPKQSAFSAGLGARITFIPEIFGNLYFAKPLTRPVATLKAMDHNANPWRIFFQLVANT